MASAFSICVRRVARKTFLLRLSIQEVIARNSPRLSLCPGVRLLFGSCLNYPWKQSSIQKSTRSPNRSPRFPHGRSRLTLISQEIANHRAEVSMRAKMTMLAVLLSCALWAAAETQSNSGQSGSSNSSGSQGTSSQQSSQPSSSQSSQPSSSQSSQPSTSSSSPSDQSNSSATSSNDQTSTGKDAS